jgi:hypothetical protein
VDLSFVISTCFPTKSGASTDVIGIRQNEIEEIRSATITPTTDGTEPSSAFPALVVLQPIYWAATFTPEPTPNASTISELHRTILNELTESLKLNRKVVIKRNNIATGNPVKRLSRFELFVISGLAITNYKRQLCPAKLKYTK